MIHIDERLGSWRCVRRPQIQSNQLCSDYWCHQLCHTTTIWSDSDFLSHSPQTGRKTSPSHNFRVVCLSWPSLQGSTSSVSTLLKLLSSVKHNLLLTEPLFPVSLQLPPQILSRSWKKPISLNYHCPGSASVTVTRLHSHSRHSIKFLRHRCRWQLHSGLWCNS